MANHVYPLRIGHSYEYPTFIKRSFMYLPHFIENLYRYILNITEMPSILHLSGSDTVSWYEFMKNLADVYRIDNQLVIRRKSDSSEFAPRPYNGGLNINLSKKLGFPQHSYLEGLEAMRELF
jgi:dTDP-4-dehydrorhamnose reductase